MSEIAPTRSNRLRSKSYPAISLREAVSRCQTLYEKDGWTETLAVTAAQHWGFRGLNGGSRPILSALKQFGLIEYVGSGDSLRVKLTELAKQILRPVRPEERQASIGEALVSPKLYASLRERFPDWKLPSDETLSARLEREEGIQKGALRSLVADVKESIAFLREAEGQQSAASTPVAISDSVPPVSDDETQVVPADHAKARDASALQTFPMPGGEAYVCLPKTLSKEEAERAKRWIEKVIVPAIEFAGDLEAAN